MKVRILLGEKRLTLIVYPGIADISPQSATFLCFLETSLMVGGLRQRSIRFGSQVGSVQASRTKMYQESQRERSQRRKDSIHQKTIQVLAVFSKIVKKIHFEASSYLSQTFEEKHVNMVSSCCWFVKLTNNLKSKNIPQLIIFLSCRYCIVIHLVYMQKDVRQCKESFASHAH